MREHLTPETLKDPPRFLKNTLTELKIKCDYNDRGCPGYVQLGNLQNHVERCGFAPVICGNEGCGMVVNKSDKEIHERELRQCHDCKDIKESQAEMKVKIDEMEIKQDDIKKSQSEMKVQNEEIERKQDEMKKNNDEIKHSQAQMKVELDEMKIKSLEWKENKKK
ncbi:E3 ubiquitin- ligase NRDP1-like [Paramuricea clavata]|uniref:E3 ubiquitin- ligase NRDP1-like n=1 Tax=Paramuricea clavata TaxID=317549 RepID=A0A6S7JAJ4_PARCT|nr:E3 ubiquitin- ligase NRDP1-like [Paramuricea clavata]